MNTNDTLKKIDERIKLKNEIEVLERIINGSVEVEIDKNKDESVIDSFKREIEEKKRRLQELN